MSNHMSGYKVKSCVFFMSNYVSKNVKSCGVLQMKREKMKELLISIHGLAKSPTEANNRLFIEVDISIHGLAKSPTLNTISKEQKMKISIHGLAKSPTKAGYSSYRLKKISIHGLAKSPTFMNISLRQLI